MMKPLAHAVLPEEVVNRIREEILTGRLRQGQKLSETELAQALSVSRAPIREGLIRLAGEGLVTLIPHRGAAVVQLSPQDTRELATLRAALEELAWAAACAKLDDAGHRELTAIVEEMRENVSAKEHERLVRLDIDFHDKVFKIASHDRLYAAWTTIKSQAALYLLTRRAVSEDYHEIVVNEHEELLTILAAGEPGRAVSAINRHIAGGYLRLLATYEAPEDVPEKFATITQPDRERV
jgi:DNA-binding GntR family transcriptional regulator